MGAPFKGLRGETLTPRDEVALREEAGVFSAERTYKGFPIRMEVIPQGTDLLVRLYGGSRPHIGSVVLSVPRPSLKDPSTLSATSSVLNLPSHQEEGPAREAGERLARELQRAVVVVGGIHYDGLKEPELDEILALCRELTEKVLGQIQSSSLSQPTDKTPSGDL